MKTRTGFTGRLTPHARGARATGAVLLEVVVALSLFFAAAVVALVGLHGSVMASRNLRLETRAANLAVTLLSEIQMGQVEVADAGPEEYDSEDDEDLADWSWEIITEDVEEQVDTGQETPLKRVQIVITYLARGFVYRLVHLMPADGGRAPADEGGENGESLTAWGAQP